MINRQIFFDQPGKNDLRIYDNIRQITTSQGDYYTTVCLVDHVHFKKYYKIKAIYFSKQQHNLITFFITDEVKEIILDFL